MSTPDSQQRLKDEAKNLQIRIDALVKDEDARVHAVRCICIYAGMLTETFIDFEEPDVVMEQAFYRIADLLKTDPSSDDTVGGILPDACQIDKDTELGRQLAQIAADKLPKGLDDVHEIAIALVFNLFTNKKNDKSQKSLLLRVLVEAVILSLTFEMAAQEFCDFLIEDFIADGTPIGDAITGLSFVAGYYHTKVGGVAGGGESSEALIHVMVREALLHGTPGTKNWKTLSASNDTESYTLVKYMEKLLPETERFFEMIGMEDILGRAVGVAKAVGRMVAVATVEDIGQIHPSIAKSLARTGMILGSRYRAEIAH